MILQLFPNIRFIKSNAKRRAVMITVAPVVLVEYVWNSLVGFVYDFAFLWNNHLEKPQ